MTAPTLLPAFKEWAPIVAALGRGEQVLILRKGGIAEGKSGFEARHPRFWLFPTHFHPAPDKLKLGLASTPLRNENDPVGLDFYGQVIDHQFLSDWEDLVALEPFHGWSTETVRERFAWAEPPGLHVFVVRVWRVPATILLPASPLWGGCKSWIDVPAAWPEHGAKPVLSDADFAAHVARLPLRPRRVL